MVTLNILGILGIAAASLALLLIVKVSLFRTSDKAGKTILLIFLFSLLAMALNSLYFFLQIHLIWPQVSFLPIILMAWIGPSLYFYVKRVTDNCNFSFKWRRVCHWLSGILLEALLIPYFLLSADKKIDFINSELGKIIFTNIFLFIYLQILAYVYLCHRSLSSFKNKYSAAPNESLNINLNWISVVCYGFVLFVIVDGILPHTPLSISGMMYVASMSLYLFVICVVFYAMGQGRVYPVVASWKTSRSKYSNSGLRHDTSLYYVEKLNQLMREENFYLDSDLSLRKLATQLGLHPHHLSQILNDNFKINFYDFVNQLRVDHAKKLLLGQPNLAIIDVALASGYNNKNSFYNSFKRFVATTPSEFRKNSSPPSLSAGVQG